MYNQNSRLNNLIIILDNASLTMYELLIQDQFLLQSINTLRVLYSYYIWE